MEDSMDPVCNINSLPEEILIEIFRYLTHNELGRVKKVCRRFNEFAGCSLLWRKVNVKLSRFGGSQSKLASNFAKSLPSSVHYMKIHFNFWDWKGKLDFKLFCVSLKARCLHTLILHNAIISDTFPSVIDLCNEFFPNLKVLTLGRAEFRREESSSFFAEDKDIECRGHPKIEVLDIFKCSYVERYHLHTFSKIPCLKKLNLCANIISDTWFRREEKLSYMNQLEWLHIGNTYIGSRTFQVLQNHSPNLTHLFLCYTDVIDDDFKFKNSVFPLLKTICLFHCESITCEGIVSLVQSATTLKNIYVGKAIAESYAEHYFVAENASKLEIVKAINKCDHMGAINL